MSLDTPVLALGSGAAAFTVTEVAIDQSDSLLELARPVLDAVMAGQGWLAAALALVFVIALARKLGKMHIPWLATDAGGMVLTLVGAFAGALVTSIAAGASVDLRILLTALGVAVAATGGYRALARDLLPRLDRAARRWKRLTPLNTVAHWTLDRTPADRTEVSR